jgi:hypothetical protein
MTTWCGRARRSSARRTRWRAVTEQAKALGINYLVTYMLMGGMTLTDALRSLRLFATEVMPKLAAL